MSSKNVLKILSVSVLVIATFFVAHPAFALTVTPARIEISGDPGTTISGQFTLINEQEDSKTFYSSTENFEAQGESGAPNFTPGTDGLATWISLVPSITLTKGEEKSIPFSITIPAHTEPGGYFAAIFLSTTPVQAQKSEVSVGARIGVLVLLHVNGDVKEGGGVIDFTAQNNSHFFSALPINFVYRFRNSGTDRVKPEGAVTIKNLFGGTTDTLQANPQAGNILPNSTRKYDVLWGNTDVVPTGFFAAARYELSHFTLGYYNVNLALSYGAKNTEAAMSTSVFVVPWQLIIIIIVILLIVLFILKVFIKRYNAYIIKQARANK